jgi:hypothetical protein
MIHSEAADFKNIKDFKNQQLIIEILYIKVNLCVCVCVCVSGIEIHNVAPILTKFGMGAKLYKGQVIGYVLAPGVDPRGQGGP